MQLFQLQDDDSWVPVPPIVAPEPEPKIIYEIRQEGAGYDWVVRCEGKPIARSRFGWRASNFSRDRARDEAVRDGITVLVREFTTNGGVCERTWTPESARENRATFRKSPGGMWSGRQRSETDHGRDARPGTAGDLANLRYLRLLCLEFQSLNSQDFDYAPPP